VYVHVSDYMCVCICAYVCCVSNACLFSDCHFNLAHDPVHPCLYMQHCFLALRVCCLMTSSPRHTAVLAQGTLLFDDCWTRVNQNAGLTHIPRVGQNRIYTPYMTVCMVISLPKILHIHCIYLKMYGSGQPYIFPLSCLLLLLCTRT
jgi:hypothetical protein